MIAHALTSAWSRRRRLAGMTAAVVLGVAFLAATLVVGTSARTGFGEVFHTANAGIDAQVRSTQRLTGGVENTRPPVAAELVDAVAAVDGVTAAVPIAEGSAQVVGEDGSPVAGSSHRAQNWVDRPALTGWRLVAGRSPAAADEVVLGRGTARDAGLDVGDTATLLVPGRVTATVVGLAAFGEDDTVGGATFVAFTTAEAQRLLLGSQDLVSAVTVVGDDGVSEAEVTARVGRVLPEGVEAVTGRALTAERQDEVEGDLVDGLTTGLLGFAFVALVVAGFGIVNTFSILAAQQVRESALLRALGASRRQVLVARTVEGALVGVVGSLVGAGVGVLVASGLLAATESIGLDLPAEGLTITVSDLATAVVVGVVMTVAGALPAAWRSSRVVPLAALREAEAGETAPRRRRAVVGGVALAAGVVLVLAAGGGDLGAAAAGAMLAIVGMVLLGPAVVRPVCGVLGAPLAARHVAGDLARRNAVRNPRRSAATAAALLVGVGVVSLFTVFGASAARSIDEGISRSFAGDLAVTPATSGAGLAPELVETIRRLPEVEAVATVGSGPAVLDGRQDDLAFADLGSLSAVVDLEVVTGDLRDDERGVAVAAAHADERGWALGDAVDVGFPDGTTATLTVTALYDRGALVGDALVSRSLWAAHVGQPQIDVAVVGLAAGVDVAAGRAAVATAVAGPGAPEVHDRDGFAESETSEVAGLLNLVYGLLGVAVVIAAMGIANTLSLSVHERTRELGLLRAVGQTQAQLRAMVGGESVLVATFGAVGGVALGTFLGWGVVRALDARADIATFALPVGALAVILAVGVAVGVLAGLRPAWRAGRLAVLDAIDAR